MRRNLGWKIFGVVAIGAAILATCKSTSTMSRFSKTMQGPIKPAGKSSHSNPVVKRTAGLAEIGPLQAFSGFPSWYKDVTGTMLEPCYYPDTMCLPPSANFNPDLPMSFPDNFSDEIFYYATSALVTTAGGGELAWEGAVEGAFANENPLPGDHVVFGRIRMRGSNLLPGKYRITHPYGVDIFDVTDAGPNGINFTEDIAPVAENFSAVLASRVGPFLKWDPAVSPAAPVGYVGDPGVPHAVVGSPFATNYVRVERLPVSGSPVVIGETNLFSVSGKKHVFDVSADKVAGSYNPAPTVKLVASFADAVIRYTTDGSDPASGTVYSAPIVLPAGALTLKFVATHPTAGTTPVKSVNYVVDPSLLAVGLAATSDKEGTYDRAVNIELEGFGSAEIIKYTIDGTNPATNPLAGTYAGGISIGLNGSYTVRAVAIRGTSVSAVRTMNFGVKTRVSDVGPINVANGFPYWIKNLATGLKLQPCLSQEETHCLPVDGINPAEPISFPKNFPDEMFYWTAEATGTFASGGSALLVLALEAAFVNENVVDGDQAVFGRIWIRLDTPTGGLFRVKHPFGIDYFEVDGPGRRSINHTEDIELAPGAFAALETGRVRALAAATPGPAGFIANPLVPTRLASAPSRFAEFTVERLDGANWVSLLSTNQFTVTGQLAGTELLSDIAPASTTVKAYPQVRLSASEDGAEIWYTTDGSSPDTSATKKRYIGPFVPTSAGSPLTVKAVAILAGQKSAITEATYIIDGKAPELSVSPVGTGVAGPTTVTFTKDDPSAIVYYTLDETDPRDSLTRIQAANTVILDPTPSVELRAVAVDPAGNFSNVVREVYTLGAAPGGGTTPAPAVSSLGYALATSGDSIVLALNWGGTTTAGTIVRYYLQASVNGSAWSDVALPTFTTKSIQQPVLIPATTSTAKYRVRAETSAGVSSPWHETPLLTFSYTSETVLTALSYNGNWAQTIEPGAIGDSLRRSVVAGDRVRFEFAGIGVAVIGAPRPNGASAEFFLDGRSVESVDTARASTTHRYPIFVRNDLAAGRRRIEAFNRSAGREFVIDGFMTMSAQ